MNPLDLRIEISNLRLFGVLIPPSAAGDKSVGDGAPTPVASECSGEIAFSTTSVELEPTASATIRLTATPLSPGRLCLQGESKGADIHGRGTPWHLPGLFFFIFVLLCSVVKALSCCLRLASSFSGVVGELFRLVQVTQWFCLHGAQRPERRFDMRYCHLDLEPEDEAQEGDTGAPEGGPYLLQQRLSMIRQILGGPETPETKTRLPRLLRGLPLLYTLDLEGFRLLHTGTPIQVGLSSESRKGGGRCRVPAAKGL